MSKEVVVGIHPEKKLEDYNKDAISRYIGRAESGHIHALLIEIGVVDKSKKDFRIERGWQGGEPEINPFTHPNVDLKNLVRVRVSGYDEFIHLRPNRSN